MRGRKFVSILALEVIGTAVGMFGGQALLMAADLHSPATPRVVYLNGVADMEKLKGANPSHYARAQKIIAASDELCKPGPDAVEFVRFDAKNISCESLLIKTSNPPKRQLGFTLDDVRYVALITLTESDAQFRRVSGQSPQPALPAQPRAPAK